MNSVFHILQATPGAVKGKVPPYLFSNGITFDPPAPEISTYFLESLQAKKSWTAEGLVKAMALSTVQSFRLKVPKPELRFTSDPEHNIYPGELLAYWRALNDEIPAVLYMLTPENLPRRLVQAFKTDTELLRAAYIYKICRAGLDMGMVATRQVGHVWLESGSRLLFLHPASGSVASYDAKVFEWFVQFTAAHGK